VNKEWTTMKTTGKIITQPTVTVRIVRGGKATEHQKKLYQAWSIQLIASLRKELESEAKGER